MPRPIDIRVKKWPGVDNYCVWMNRTLKKCFRGKNGRSKADDWAEKLERKYVRRQSRHVRSSEKYSGISIRDLR